MAARRATWKELPFASIRKVHKSLLLAGHPLPDLLNKIEAADVNVERLRPADHHFICHRFVAYGMMSEFSPLVKRQGAGALNAALIPLAKNFDLVASFMPA
ncbi:uncharacterized protein PHALS_01971 [Plasmopara halstedii]|uniref:Uncharacterized protein n=1 Tax=Plasmopara halstedii TaxID=4781 RepID=A0A0P1AU86_PLAHL|nr:uncharacterized protein PHALS_01971 [Plasmopara halstedii]CEG45690.1 hypothetical protein PHALS_01971 [Plasmopara halstedii]|eukprot:XP_024582059.1 hypothetical protein PHALS_01971 [Plasmopara halstedii]